MTKALRAAIVESAGRIIVFPLSAMPLSCQPSRATSWPDRFQSSIHSSEVESDEPAQEISPIVICGGASAAKAVSAERGLKMAVRHKRVHEIRRKRDALFWGIVFG